MSKKLVPAALALAIVFGLAGREALAESPCMAGGWWDAPWAGIRNYDIPYYAAYPPVYYSHPVARTYGHSPYAYPGFMKTPERGPLSLINPHVGNVLSGGGGSGMGEFHEQTSAVTSEPQVVTNPFVKPVR